MSFFIGVFSLSTAPVRAQAHALEAAAALPGQFRLSSYSDSRLVILHGDLDVLPDPGWFESDQAVGAAAGSLLLSERRSDTTELTEAELSQAVSEMNAGRTSFLRHANGTFAVCAYDKRSRQLTLAADSLGARPLYYAESNGELFFATGIDAITRLKGVARTYDIATYIEEEALCYPLGCRTRFAHIRVVVDNEAVTASEGQVHRTRYFDWRSVAPARGSMDEMAAHCRTALRAAVENRARPGTPQTALLSGGLDSRVLVAELLDLGRDAAAVNVSPPGSQDQVYAVRFAERVGFPLKTVAATDEMAGMSAADCTATLLGAAVEGLAPGCAFSGDGGGETFGFLLMKASAAHLMRDGKVRAAVDDYLSSYAPPRKLVKRAAYEQLRTVVHDRMELELRRIGVSLGEKALHIFVLTNDLRCHLHEYFNRLPSTRVELLLPFYDRRVIESVLRIPAPIEPLMKHTFYYRMLGLLPPSVTVVPWQTYPGHVPCPVADEAPPPNQWSVKGRFGDTLLSRCLKVALAPGFAPILRRSTVLAALGLHKLGLANFTYLFKTCLNLQARCGNGADWVLRHDSLDNGPSREGARGLK